MNYKTYAEAKIANPDSEIVTTGKNWGGGKDFIGTFEAVITGSIGKHIIDDINWAICNPADYCSNLEDYLDAGFKLARGDWVVTIYGIADKVRSVSAMNSRDFNDYKRYILSAAALNGGCKIPAKAEQGTVYDNTAQQFEELASDKPVKPVFTQAMAQAGELPSMSTFSYPCVAVNIEASKPTALPKEDKLMKPVYTAEMHAKGELPPVGAECEALCMDATNSKHAWAKAKILMHHEGNECAVYCIDARVLRWADEFRLIPKTIKVNGFDVPAPMSEAPEFGARYFIVSPDEIEFFNLIDWEDDEYDYRWLSRGLCHTTKEAAIAHAKAMLGIAPNA